MRERRARGAEADLRHRGLELLAVLGLVDRFARGADQLDAVFLQHALTCQIQCAVERLAAHRRKQRIGALLLDDARHHLPLDRLDAYVVSAISGSVMMVAGVRVHQHHAVALGAQRLAGLHAGVIELARLADDDRAGADDEHAFGCRSPASSISLANRSKR